MRFANALACVAIGAVFVACRPAGEGAAESMIVNAEGGVSQAPQVLRAVLSDSMARVYSRGHCTGTLVSPTRLLLAKHCVDDHEEGRPINAYFVADLSSYEALFRANDPRWLNYVAALDNVRSHPTSDIATVDLKSGPKPGKVPVAIAKPVTLPQRTSFFVAGYGKRAVNEGNDAPVYLMWGRVILDRWVPKVRTFEGNEYVGLIRTVPGPSGSLTCNGDSGGPLLREIPGTSRLAIVGVVSGGDRLCASHSHHADVRPHRNWICEGTSGCLDPL